MDDRGRVRNVRLDCGIARGGYQARYVRLTAQNGSVVRIDWRKLRARLFPAGGDSPVDALARLEAENAHLQERRVHNLEIAERALNRAEAYEATVEELKRRVASLEAECRELRAELAVYRVEL